MSRIESRKEIVKATPLAGGSLEMIDHFSRSYYSNSYSSFIAFTPNGENASVDTVYPSLLSLSGLTTRDESKHKTDKEVVSLVYDLLVTVFAQTNDPGSLIENVLGNNGAYNRNIISLDEHSPLSTILKTEEDDLVKSFAFILMSRLKVDAKEAVALAKKHIEMTKDFDLSKDEDVFFFLNAHLLVFGEKEKYFHRVFQRLLTYKTLKSPSYREFLIRAFIAFEDESFDDDTALKDVPVDYSFKVRPELLKNIYSSTFSKFIELPIHTQKYRDYLLDKTIGDIKKLQGVVPKSGSVDSSITASETVLSKSETPELSVEETLARAITATLPAIVRANYFAISTGIVLDHLTTKKKDTELLNFVSDYFEALGDVTSVSWQILKSHIDITVGDQRSKWIKDVNSAGTALSELKKVLSPIETMELVYNVSRSKDSLTYNQWMKFVKNVEEYKDVPLDWWMPLVRGR